MKIRWTGERRALAEPQIEVDTGDLVDLPERVALSFIDQGLAEKAGREPKE